MVTLTKFKVKDAKYVQDNFSCYFRDSSIGNIKNILKEWKNEDSLAFSIQYDNLSVGIISLTQKATVTLSFGIFILENYRGKSIATDAFTRASQIAKNKGYTEIISSCSVDNTASIAMHKKFGFKLIKTEVNNAGNKMCRWIKYL